MTSLTLTADELVDITGRKKKSMQIEWLRTRRWVFELDANGKPKVSRAHAEAMLGANTPTAEPKAWAPDFSDLQATG